MCNFCGSLNRFQAPEPPDRVGVLGNADADERPGAVPSAKRLADQHEQSCPSASDSRERPAPLSPTPWSVERSHLPGMAREARVVDADGDPVTDYIALMDAETIADAVNARDALRAERDRLRDLAWRFAEYAETYHHLGVQGKALVAEARAALYRTPPAALDVVTQNPPLPAPETSTTA